MKWAVSGEGAGGSCLQVEKEPSTHYGQVSSHPAPPLLVPGRQKIGQGLCCMCSSEQSGEAEQAVSEHLPLVTAPPECCAAQPQLA